MTWYASHIYAQSSPPMISVLKSHPALKQGLYLVNDLSNYQWPEAQIIGDKTLDFRHNLPHGGLFVVRELCGPGMNDRRAEYEREVNWHKQMDHTIIRWNEVNGPSNLEIILPPGLPVFAWGKLFPGQEKPYPPLEFLRFLKWLNLETKSVIAFYRHYEGAGGDVDQEYSWVFDEADCVYVSHVETTTDTWCYTESHAEKVEGHWMDIDPLRLTMKHFNVQMGSRSFALHQRDFPWDKYRMKGV